MNQLRRACIACSVVLLLCSVACAGSKESTEELTSQTPTLQVMIEDDTNPIILHSDDWEAPQPLPAPIDMDGDELAPFITLAGDELYFFYTPDISISEAKRALDGISGIFSSKKIDGVWSEPEKLVLSEENSMDSCIYISGQTLWFCSKRDGNYREEGDLYTASRVDGVWQNWQNAGEQLNMDYDAGEVHLSADQNTMIFSAFRYGGFGLTDLWQTQLVGESWSEPVNLGGVINSTGSDDYPYLSEDGSELWFTSPSRLGYSGFAIFRSIWQDGAWGEPQEIISNNVSEVSIDRAGNLYFVHFFIDEEGELLGSKIYIAQKK